MDIKKYRRLYPKVRLSWTAYHLWESGRWEQLKAYLLEQEEFKSGAMLRGSELHKLAEHIDFMPLPPGVEKPTKTYSEFKLELDRPGGTIVSVIDKLAFYEDEPAFILDYKAGKLYPYYKKQIQFYLTTLSLHLGQQINQGYLVPITYETDERVSISVNGDMQFVYFTKHQDFMKKIDKALYDILFKIDEGWLDNG